MTTSDLLIIGGGPAGLSAAINGASEGLDVRLLDNGLTLGGQAKESSGIENYPGFPEGITGNNLMSRMGQQARKFAARVIAPVSAVELIRDGDAISVVCDDYTVYHGRSVLLSLGVSYRRLQADNIGHFIGRGVFYGVPAWKPASNVRTVAVIGGANSAGQAVLGLAKNQRLDVKLLVRKSLTAQMSQYLIDRIKDTPNIEVVEFCEVAECQGTDCLKEIYGKIENKDFAMKVDNLYIFIGAIPKTRWLQGTVDCDKNNFILTGSEVSPTVGGIGMRMTYETSQRGVFAAGDVRSGSTKRIATSIGEGAGALQMIHKYLGDR